MPARLVHVCMTCEPGRTKAEDGVMLTHGYCRPHELQELEKYALITDAERVELNNLRAGAASLTASPRPNLAGENPEPK